MFGTSIHWTTYFYLLIDTVIVLFTAIQSLRLKLSGFRRYIVLGILFIIYNATGGFLPMDNFPGPFILQYVITYGTAIILCIYIVYYLYKEYDFAIFEMYWSITNISLLLGLGFIILFLTPYFITGSLDKARAYFTIPFALIGFYFLGSFCQRISHFPKSNSFALRRCRLSILSAGCIVLLPILTVIGDYQWLTFTVMNFPFYAITAIEVDRYLYVLENKNKMLGVIAFYENKGKLLKSKLLHKSLTRREIEIAVSMLSNQTYKQISETFFIAERTVSKHASNIFKKTGVKNKTGFLAKFESRK
ncbi:helix-turn-helix domain-containing protein [Aquimarina algiphila]|uniref:helix-turn-helix domain-containing protein n=1 Tax=Aquimarina algiphila TaxID=2047982 RepID=UPI00232C8257|nr:helix-turn-helix transcriptional regulator [Aquimarina algiphila]